MTRDLTGQKGWISSKVKRWYRPVLSTLSLLKYCRYGVKLYPVNQSTLSL